MQLPITAQESYIELDEARLEDRKMAVECVHGFNVFYSISFSISRKSLKLLPGMVPDTWCTKMTKTPTLLSSSYQIMRYRQTSRQYDSMCDLYWDRVLPGIIWS